MLSEYDIEHLPRRDRAVNRASHDYFRALVTGAPVAERVRLRRLWLREIGRRWPSLRGRRARDGT